MSIKSDDIADFFRQLSLMVKSDLPLPESLRSIAAETASRGFHEQLLESIKARWPLRKKK